MNPFGGDPRFHALFAEMREDELARRARRRLLAVQGERTRPRVRAVVARTLRRVADRLAPAEAPTELRPPQRDAAPRAT